MKQAIAGVSPPSVSETTIMTVWPSLAATGIGRGLGRLYGISIGIGWLTLGKLIVLLSIPVVLPLFFLMLLPFSSRRYRLTNRRVIIEKGVAGRPERWVELDRFDAIDVVVLPGQAWYPAGDLVFRNGQVETFRLSGVMRPETFKQTCLKARNGFVGVRQAIGAAR